MPNNIFLAFKNNLKMKFLIFTVCLITIGNCAVLKSTEINSWEQFKVNKLFYFFEELNCTNLSHFFTTDILRQIVCLNRGRVT